jgi:methionyl-tRNA formyltransferase
MKITIIVDNPKSFMLPHAKKLMSEIEKSGHECKLVHSQKSIKKGDVCVILSCEEKIPQEILKLNNHNLVVHESELPKGRGWSPLTWQILEGKSKIPMTLFEAAEELDAGDVYIRDYLKFKGHELNSEMKEAQGKKTIEMILKFLKKFTKGKKQKGKATFYKKRGPKDSELNINKSLKDLFPLLRVVDNERYPAFFKFKGKKYKLKIEKIDK